MADDRTRLLQAAQEASRILDRQPESHRTSFDILGELLGRGIPVLFRPLKNLLGATVTINGERGVLITTKLPLSVQRFTLAHELGHIVLGHENQFDEAVGAWMPRGRGTRSTEEKAADLFASDLLAPRNSILRVARKRGWDADRLQMPASIYQVALRLGISFQATCWALEGHGLLPRPTVATLSKPAVVKRLKNSIIKAPPGANPWADVWELSEADDNTYLEAGPDDVFAVQLRDHPSAGFLWEVSSPPDEYEVLREELRLDAEYGSPVRRTVFLCLKAPGAHQILLRHRRPWNEETSSTIDVAVENWGKEEGGLSRRERTAGLAEGFA